MDILGIDIGGSGIKGAPVNTQTGELTAERCRYQTPSPATPKAVGAKIARLVKHFQWDGPIGCGFPAVVRDGHTLTASNVSPAWIGYDARSMFEQVTNCQVTVINDADAAGYAEMRFGAGRDVTGVVLVVTLGTGIGTALFNDGHLVRNTELGHIEIKGKIAEKWTAASVREQEELGWKKWARRLNTYLTHMERYLWPDLIIIGGGISKKHEKFMPLLSLQTRLVPAQMRNEAGIVGAALAALRVHDSAAMMAAT